MWEPGPPRSHLAYRQGRRLCAGFFGRKIRLLKSEQNQLYLEGWRVPLYEYQCKKCKHRFEKIQKFSDPPVKKCPECGSPVEKLLHAPAVQFKGSGWYVTDYAGKKPGGETSGEKKEEKPAAKDKDAGADRKPKKSEAKKDKE